MTRLRRKHPFYIVLSLLVLLSSSILFSNTKTTTVTTHALSSSSAASTKPPKPVRRVAIIGSGIAGLTTAHALVSSSLPSLTSQDDTTSATTTTKNTNIDVTIFDYRDGLDRGAGAGMQLNGGLAVLGEINPDLREAVQNAGQTLELIRSRAKPWDPTKDYDTLLELPLRKIISDAGGETKDALLQGGDNLMWTSIMRGALQETLCNTLPQHTKSQIQFGKLLTGIQPAAAAKDDADGGTGGVTCEFSDGTTAGPFDLIVGADGIKSAVKEYVDKGRISQNPSKREGAAAGFYSGLRIRYAVRDGTNDDSLSTKTDNNEDELPCITQYFGDAAYCFSGVFGAGNGRPNTKCAFITFLDEDYFGPFQRRKPPEMAEENADWTQDNRQSVEVARSTMLQQIRDCNVPDLDLRDTIENADRFFELGVYAHNPFSSWWKEVPGTDGSHVVLVGDAAHALPPFLGQGANQALQDAYSLGVRIKQYNSNVIRGGGEDDESVSLKSFLRDYEKTRWPAAFQIFWKATFLGYLETGGFNGAYAKFRDLFFKTMGILGVASYILLNAATPVV